jgi:uncharacterized protein YjdB
MDSKVRKNNYHRERSKKIRTAGNSFATGFAKKLPAVFACLLCMAALSAMAQSPYIHRIYDFMPAPGQFVNTMPEYEPGDTQADMNRKAEEAIAGTHHNEGMISLGGYGGYVVFGFDHEVENVPGKYDFRILGNAFYAGANPNGEAVREGGSSEPGIVMVARDVNGNGLPDDPWYELAGSEYRRPATIRRYRITYTRPDEDKARVPHPSEEYVNDMEYVRWTTNGHGSGYLYRNDFHSQPYFPQWIADETLTFEGTRLADNAADESGEGSYYVLYAAHWGYADNHPNADPRSGFGIEWAVDGNGNPVTLPGIHFVKVYTAVNQNCGWLGEVSTEISGAEDLHLTGGDTTVPVFVDSIALNRTSAELYVEATLTLVATLAPANATNRAVTWRSDAPEVATVAAGTVTAHRTGTAMVQAIANDGYYIAECRITVSNAPEDPEPEPEPEPTPTPEPEPEPEPEPAPEPEPGAVRVTGVTLSRTQLEMQPGEMARLTAVVTPDGATDRTVRWSSSAPGVADVTVNGLVLAGAPGTATVSVTTTDGGYVATCRVKVGTSSAAGAVDDNAPQVRYAAGTLHLVRLEGYACTLFSSGGRRMDTFRPASPDERRPCRLAPGIYFLTAQRRGERLTFKIPAGY